VLTELTHQGATAEKSSVQLLNQGASRECAEYHSRGSFFGSFLDKQKRTGKHFYLRDEESDNIMVSIS
jgi:hypothetical protein